MTPATGETRLEPSDLEAAEQEIRRLERELREVAEEREILKSSEHFLTERVMKYTFIAAHSRRPFHPVMTQRQAGAEAAPNRLNQDFSALAPNQKWSPSSARSKQKA